MKAKHNNIQFSVISESDIFPGLDRAIREILIVCFPADREYFQARSWWHCVPIYRVIGRGDGEGTPFRENFAKWEPDSIAAHAAIVERTVIVGQGLTKIRVAGVQGFCVLPGYRGTGLSDKMMSIAMEQANKGGFDAGLLFCVDELRTVYGRMGWHRLDSNVYMPDEKEGKRLIPAKNITMFYPIGTKQFPPGDIDLAGTDW